MSISQTQNGSSSDQVCEVALGLPDDFHVHLRDGAMLAAVAKYTASQFSRAW